MRRDQVLIGRLSELRGRLVEMLSENVAMVESKMTHIGEQTDG
ncbi:hypothetical protein [Kozakia baliensis]|nr:hypothetical protein [Kozakia baliensis]